MSEVRVAQRYAKSLVSLAKERQELDRVHDDMLLVRDTLTENRNLLLTLRSPIINTGKKLSITKAIFGSQFCELSNAFIEILCRKGREAYLLAVSNEVHRLYNQLHNVQVAKVVTTYPLDEAMRESVKSAVKRIANSDQVELQEEVDQEIIGGILLRVGDRQLDDTVRTRLRTMRKEMSENLFEKQF